MVFLATAKAEANPLLKEQVCIMAFIVLVRLDSFMEKNAPVGSSVRVHQLTAEDSAGTWSGVLPFQPTSLSLNLAESAFIMTSAHGVWIDDLPGTIKNMINH